MQLRCIWLAQDQPLHDYGLSSNHPLPPAASWRGALAGADTGSIQVVARPRMLAVARELGLRVPEDVSIVGFDDVPGGQRSNPPLTTITQPHRDKGRLAARKLFALVQGQPVDSATTLPTSLVIRGSTAIARR